MKNNLLTKVKIILRILISFQIRLKIFWRLECLKLALSSANNNIRTKGSEEIATNFFKYLNKLEKSEIDDKVKILKKDLDENSQKEIDTFLSRQEYVFKNNLLEQNKLFTRQEKEEQKLSNKESIKTIKKLRKFNLSYYAIESFYGINGLRWLPEEKKQNLQNKIFLDLGAFDGDSAISFYFNFKPKKIYCFEPEKHNFDRLTQNSNILGNNIIEPIKKGVSNKTNTANISSQDSISNISSDQNLQKIDIISTDEYINKNNIEKVDVIKMDIEGEEMNAIIGATETIKRYKPILSISIYHTPIDFFEIKPYLKELVPEYKFIIKKANPFALTHELMLLAYV